MRKIIVFFILLLVGGRAVYTYLMSDKFQEYGDRTRQPWTCQANMLLGQFNVTLSHYGAAQKYFMAIRNRCPDTKVAEEAEYRIAQCLEKTSGHRAARDAYLAFVEKYPQSRYARLASQAAEILRN